MAGYEGGAGGEQVVHLTELVDAATRQRLGAQADGAEGLALANLVEGAALVIHQQIEFDGMLLQQGGDSGKKPGGQAVGVDGDADPDWPLRCGGSQLPRQFELELMYLPIVGQQLLAE